jgi:predicted PurR-regulated permease PerM
MAPTETTEQDRLLQARVTQAAIRIAVLGFLIYLCLRILQPFINPIIGGIVVAIALHVPYEKLARAVGRPGLASVILIGSILVLLIVPILFLGASLVDTAGELSKSVHAEEISVPPPPDAVADWPIVGQRAYDAWLAASRNLESVLAKLAPYVKDVALWLVETMGNLGFGLLMFVVAIVIGGALLPVRERGVATTRKVATIIAGERGPVLADLVAASVQSVIRGVIGVAIIQSVFAGIGMLVIGVPGAGLWALLILLLAVMQLPAGLVLIPVVFYVFATKATAPAVIFTVYAVLVGASDNVLRPLLMGRGSQTPMLVLFMGSLGGFIAGGILGLFVGAVVLSIGYTVFMAWVDDNDAPKPARASAAGAPESSPGST